MTLKPVVPLLSLIAVFSLAAAAVGQNCSLSGQWIGSYSGDSSGSISASFSQSGTAVTGTVDGYSVSGTNNGSQVSLGATVNHVVGKASGAFSAKCSTLAGPWTTTNTQKGTTHTGTFKIEKATISLKRLSLTEIEAIGAPDGGSFAYASKSLTGQNIATIDFANGVIGTDNPNDADLLNPQMNAAPVPGGLADMNAKYTVSGLSPATDDFQVPTFGMSCYFTTLESDWGTPPSKCGKIRINGVTYTGTVTNPDGLTGTYCSAFIAEIVLQGSGVLNDGTDLQYNAQKKTIITVPNITGSDGTPVVKDQTVARDKGPISSCTRPHFGIIPTKGVHVAVDQVGTGLLANDTGCAIAGYRLDLYRGAGKSMCQNYENVVSVSACSPKTDKCPSKDIK